MKLSYCSSALGVPCEMELDKDVEGWWCGDSDGMAIQLEVHSLQRGFGQNK